MENVWVRDEQWEREIDLSIRVVGMKRRTLFGLDKQFLAIVNTSIHKTWRIHPAKCRLSF